MADPVAVTDLTDERLRELFRRLKPAVWVLRMEGNGTKARVENICTGFCVTKEVHILTCAHGWTAWSGLKIEGRRLNEDGFKYTLTVTYPERKWDMALLKINDLDSELDCVELADSGFVGEGDVVLQIGHAVEYVGSCLLGRAAYACPHDVPIPFPPTPCHRYVPGTIEKTPTHRIMGLILNKFVLESSTKTECLEFEKRLHANLPIIQCNGLTCGPGASGGPLYNVHGKVIGLLIMQHKGYEIAVCLPVIREFMKRALGG